MPAKSERQQRLMGMALAAKRGKGHFDEKIKRIAESMTEKQLHDFASTKHDELPEKKAAVDLVKWAIQNNMMPVPASGPGMPRTAPYLGPTTGPGVINPAGGSGMLGRIAKKVAPIAHGGLGIMDAVDASDRAAHGDNTGAWISRIGALGGAAGMIPHPLTRGIGTAVSIGSGLINAYRDRNGRYGGIQQPVAPQPMAPPVTNNTVPPTAPAASTVPVAQQPVGDVQAAPSIEQPTQEAFNSFGGGEYSSGAGPAGEFNSPAIPQRQQAFNNKLREYAQLNPEFQKFLQTSGFGDMFQEQSAPPAPASENMYKTSELREALKFSFRKKDV